MNQNYARVDYLKFSTMEHVHRLVREAVELGQTNPSKNLADAILEFAGEILETVQGDKKMNDLEIAFVKALYRRFLEPLDKLESAITNGEEYSCIELAEEYSKKVFDDVFGGKVPPSEADFVDKFYEMNPETEDVLHNGTLIEDGMRVLIETPSYRVDIHENMSEAALSHARMMNRWCTVEKSRVSVQEGSGLLAFTGIYDDGVKRRRNVHAEYAWIVKKDSIPRVDTIIDTQQEGCDVFTATTYKVLEMLKSMPKGFHTRYNVKIGETDFVVPSDQYLICEGEVPKDEAHLLRKAAIADTEVFDENGLSVLSGTVYDMHAWAKSLPGNSKYRTYRLRYAGTDKIVKVRDFIERPVWDGKDRSVDTYGVLTTTNSLICEGSKEDVIEFLTDDKDHDFLTGTRVFYGDNYGVTVSSLDFVNNRPEQDVDC
jgi:hypothetical protein